MDLPASRRRPPPWAPAGNGTRDHQERGHSLSGRHHFSGARSRSYSRDIDRERDHRAQRAHRSYDAHEMGASRGFGSALHRSRSPPRGNRRDASPPRQRSAERRGFSAEQQHHAFSEEQHRLAARDRIEKAQTTPTGRADLETAKGIMFSKKIASNESIDTWAKDATERGDLHHKERLAYLMADLDQCALFFQFVRYLFPRGQGPRGG